MIEWVFTIMIYATVVEYSLISLSRRKIGWLLLGVVCALTVSSSTGPSEYGDRLAWLYRQYPAFAYEEPLLSQLTSLEALASSFPADTAKRGAHAARTDLQHGIRRIMVYGLVRDLSRFSEMKSHGFEIVLGGCLTPHVLVFGFWQGYNSEMVAEAKRLHVADIPDLL